MQYKLKLTDRLLLIIILSVAAGFLLAVPYFGDNNDNLNKTISGVKNDDYKINSCETTTKKDNLSLILNNNVNNKAPACLFVGCSGFSF